MRWGGKRGGRESVGGTCVSWTFQSAYLSAHFPEGDLETAVSRGEGRGGGGGEAWGRKERGKGGWGGNGRCHVVCHVVCKSVSGGEGARAPANLRKIQALSRRHVWPTPPLSTKYVLFLAILLNFLTIFPVIGGH